MFSVIPIANADAAVIKLLTALGLYSNHADVIAELDKHPDYPNLLAVSDVLTAFSVETRN